MTAREILLLTIMLMGAMFTFIGIITENKAAFKAAQYLFLVATGLYVSMAIS